MTIVVVIGIVLLFLGLLFVMSADLKGEKFGGWFITALVIVPAFMVGLDLKTEQFAVGVDLRQVAVKGENHFQAEIEIIYKNGKLEKIVLVPETTISKTTLSTSATQK